MQGKARYNASRTNQTSHYGIMGGLAPMGGTQQFLMRSSTRRLVIPPGAIEGKAYMEEHDILSKNPAGSAMIGRNATLVNRGIGPCECTGTSGANVRDGNGDRDGDEVDEYHEHHHYGLSGDTEHHHHDSSGTHTPATHQHSADGEMATGASQLHHLHDKQTCIGKAKTGTVGTRGEGPRDKQAYLTVIVDPDKVGALGPIWQLSHLLFVLLS